VRALELEPNFLPALLDLGIAYVWKSMDKKGIAQLENAVAIYPDKTPALWGLGCRRVGG
jgi:hypothetical protein